MASLSEEIGIEALLAPFAGDAVTGHDPREDFSPQAPYRVLRNARGAARAAERAADADADAEAGMVSEWRTVRQSALKILSSSAKDLEVAAWLTEALVRSDGLRGLEAGALVITGLARAFWAGGLFPTPDPEDPADRVAAVEGLSGSTGDGTIIQPLRKLALFTRPDGDAVPLYKFDQSMKLQGESDKAKIAARIASGVVPFADLERDAKALGGAPFAALRRQARAALQAWNEMAETLDGLAEAHGPSTGRVRAVLEEILDVARRFAPAEVEEAAADEPEAEAAAAAATAAPGPVRASAAETREDMLHELGRIAVFFRRTEPHSPLSYTLDEAVRRGRLSLPDLLEELVPDVGARGLILTQLGIRMVKPE